MKINIEKNEITDFVVFAQELTGGGFNYKYNENQGLLQLRNIDPSFEAQLLDWKSQPEYDLMTKKQKFDKIYRALIKKFVLNQIKNRPKLYAKVKDLVDQIESSVDSEISQEEE